MSNIPILSFRGAIIATFVVGYGGMALADGPFDAGWSPLDDSFGDSLTTHMHAAFDEANRKSVGASVLVCENIVNTAKGDVATAVTCIGDNCTRTDSASDSDASTTIIACCSNGCESDQKRGAAK